MPKTTLVLLVPGDPLTGRLTESGLQGYGFDVRVARDTSDAMNLLLANRRIGVLVVDADVANGLALAKAARSARPQLLVVYTARLPNKVSDREKVSGAPCIRAPYHPHQLVGVISGLARRPAADEQEAA
jgi:DNA-binding response OmpR family regulator